MTNQTKESSETETETEETQPAIENSGAHRPPTVSDRKYRLGRFSFVAIVFFTTYVLVSSMVLRTVEKISESAYLDALSAALTFGKWGLGIVLILFIGGNVGSHAIGKWKG